MLDGLEGPAKQAAMRFLVSYGEALGAEEFIDTNNVHSLILLSMYPDILNAKLDINDIDAFVSKSVLNSDERIVVDRVAAFTSTHISSLDRDNLDSVKISFADDSEEMIKYEQALIDYAKRIGMVLTESCTPFITGNLPVKGEHCAWVESSAIAFANSIIGARTNIEGNHSSFASALTGKTPNWGMHLDENRRATIKINVRVQPQNALDWYLLGFWAGPKVGQSVPVFDGITVQPDQEELLALAAGGTASGAIIMFHVVGITPEAETLEQATGGKEIEQTLEYGPDERKAIYDMLNYGKNKNVQYVMIGCPHLNIKNLSHIANLLKDKHVKTKLMLFTNKTALELAKSNGVYDTIINAGAKLISGSCPNFAKIEQGNVLAVDSPKFAFTAPIKGHGFFGCESVWLGTMDECIDAAITGLWKGELK